VSRSAIGADTSELLSRSKEVWDPDTGDSVAESSFRATREAVLLSMRSTSVRSMP